MKASPLTVFLTILIILTIVLGLYTYLTPPYDGRPPPPQGSFANVQRVNVSDSVFFGPFNRDVKPSEIMIIVDNMTTPQSTMYDMPANDLPGPLTARTGGNLTGINSIVYTDLAGDKKISEGDYITITYTYAFSGSMSYWVIMVYVPIGSYVDSIIIMWPHS